MHGHGHAAWTWTCSMDIGYVAWTFRMDMVVQHGHELAWTWTRSMDFDMQYRPGHAAWTCSMDIDYYRTHILGRNFSKAHDDMKQFVIMRTSTL